jgi:hypothetical protein
MKKLNEFIHTQQKEQGFPCTWIEVAIDGGEELGTYSIFSHTSVENCLQYAKSYMKEVCYEGTIFCDQWMQKSENDLPMPVIELFKQNDIITKNDNDLMEMIEEKLKKPSDAHKFISDTYKFVPVNNFPPELTLVADLDDNHIIKVGDVVKFKVTDGTITQKIEMITETKAGEKYGVDVDECKADLVKRADEGLVNFTFETCWCFAENILAVEVKN